MAGYGTKNAALPKGRPPQRAVGERDSALRRRPASAMKKLLLLLPPVELEPEPVGQVVAVVAGHQQAAQAAQLPHERAREPRHSQHGAEAEDRGQEPGRGAAAEHGAQHAFENPGDQESRSDQRPHDAILRAAAALTQERPDRDRQSAPLIEGRPSRLREVLALLEPGAGVLGETALHRRDE
jgi:hypothetical protein